MPSKFQGQIFEFAHKRMVLVDAEVKEDGNNKPQKHMSENQTECPFIIDKKTGFKDKDHYREYQLNETGAFILRFVLDKVTSDLIAQIYLSQYGGTLEAAEQAVDGFIGDLLQKELLKPAQKAITQGPAASPQVFPAKPFLGLLLDFSVGLNRMNKYRIKIVT